MMMLVLCVCVAVWLMLGACQPVMAQSHQDESAGSSDVTLVRWGGETPLALAPGGYASLRETFGDLVVADAGTAPIETQWPYIHPGPVDGWAGSTQHTYVLRFQLPEIPKGGLRLDLRIQDVHDGAPPTLSVLMNGRGDQVTLSPGLGQGYAQAGVGKGSEITLFFPASQLRLGENRLAITSVQGSWFVYESVSLISVNRQLGYDVSIADIEPLPLYPRTEHGMNQTARVAFRNTGMPLDDAYFEVFAASEASDGQASESLSRVRVGRLPYGQSVRQIQVPDLQPGPVVFSLTSADGEVLARRQVQWKPARKWTVYLVQHSHTDLGYTDPQDKVLDIHLENIDLALEYAEQTKDWPDEAKFRYAVEVSWALKHYLDRLAMEPDGERRLEQLKSLVHQKIIGVEGLYLNQLYSVEGLEELVRNLYPVHRDVAKELDYRPVTGVLTDVPGITWSIVPLLSDVGVKYLDLAPNDVRLMHTIHRPSAFYWEGPGGNGRVLTLTRIDPPVFSYHEGNNVGFTDSLLSVELKLPERLNELAHKGYDFDLYPMRVQGIHPSGRYIDNTTASMLPATITKAWNEKYAYPKVVSATHEMFYEAFERRYSAELPVYRGDLSDWWNDGVASSAHETSLSRQTRLLLPAAESLTAVAWTQGWLDEYPDEAIRKAYDDLIHYHEHTWGSDDARPTNPAQQVIWKNKSGFATDAFTTTNSLFKEALSLLASRVSADGCELVVYNPHAYPVTGPVEIALNDSCARQLPIAVLDVATGERATVQNLAFTANAMSFIAQDVPPVGFKRFRLIAEGAGAETVSAPAVDATAVGATTVPAVSAASTDDGFVAENEFFFIRINREGRLESVLHKPTEREWVDDRARHNLGEYSYWLTDGSRREYTMDVDRVVVEEVGPVKATLAVYGHMRNHPQIIRRYTLWAHTDRLDVSLDMQKDETMDTEVGFVAFPLAIEDAEARWAIPGAHVTYFDDQLAGSSLDWQAIDTWADLSNSDEGITFSSQDAPLVWFGRFDLDRNRPRPGSLSGKEGPIDKTLFVPEMKTIYSLIINNTWHVNYKRSQGGHLTFRYTLQPHAGPVHPMQADVLGRTFEVPLQAVWAADGGEADIASESFVVLKPATDDHRDASGAQPIITVMKRSEEGSDLVVRLHDVAGNGGAYHLQLNRLSRKVIRAVQGDPVERIQRDGHNQALPIEADGVRIDLRPYEIKTVVLTFDGAGGDGD